MFPSGFLECNGAAVSRSTYATLFAEIGTTYGSGDGSSTFNLPDLQDRCCVSKSGTKSLASTGGAETVTSTGNVAGSTANATLSESQLGAHDHGYAGGGSQFYTGNNALGSATTGQISRDTGSAGSGQGHSHNMSATFSGDATSVLQPYLTIIYIIKT